MPPTDPRYLSATHEMMLLDWEHYKIDHPELAKDEHYDDPEYEAWEAEVAAEDAQITVRVGSDEKTSRTAKRKGEVLDYLENQDWEDVEIDDDPDFGGEE